MDSATGQPLRDDSYYEEGDDVYSYDYDESLRNLPVSEFSAVAAFYGLAFVLGCAGNSLVVYCVSKHRRMRTTTNYFLLSLACADLLLVVVCVPVKLAGFFSYTWSFGEFVCKLVHCTQTASMTCSILTLTTISLERYYAISRPIRAKYLCTRRHAQMVILGIWVTSFAAAIPTWFGQVHKVMGVQRKATWCTREWSAYWIAVAYEATTYGLLFVLPVAVMIMAYCGVYRQLRLVPLESREDSPPTQSQQQQPQPPTLPKPRFGRPKSLASSASRVGLIKMMGECPSETVSMRKSHTYDVSIRCQVVKMLVAVVVIFITCWGPLLTFSLLKPLGIFEEYFPNKYPYVKPMKEAFYLMAYFNSCVNPIIYGFMSRYFRKSFQQALVCCSVRPRAGSISRSTLIRTSIKISIPASAEKFLDADDMLVPAMTCRRASSTVATPMAVSMPVFSYDMSV